MEEKIGEKGGEEGEGEEGEGEAIKGVPNYGTVCDTSYFSPLL